MINHGYSQLVIETNFTFLSAGIVISFLTGGMPVKVKQQSIGAAVYVFHFKFLRRMFLHSLRYDCSSITKVIMAM